MAHNNKDLSVGNRRSFKENEAKIDEVLNKITAATKGAKWTYECDWVRYQNVLEAKGTKNAMGEIMLAKLHYYGVFIPQLYQDALLAEAFDEHASAHKIFVQLHNTDIKSNTSLKDGVVYLNLSEDYANASYNDSSLVTRGGTSPGCDLQRTLERTTVKSSSLTIGNRKNLKENEAKIDEVMNKITAATKGAKWTYSTDLVKYQKILEEKKQTVSALGDIIFAKVEYFGKFIPEIFTDELMGEAFNEKVTVHNIRIELVPQDGKAKTEFKDGMIVLLISEDNSNQSYNNSDRKERAGNSPGCDLWYNLEH